MASSARIFFAGVGTTFLILGAGFGGGLLMANSALKEPTGYQAKAKAEPSAPPARIVLPTTAQAAQPPEQPQEVAAVEPAPQPIQAAPAASQAEKIDTKKAEKEERDRKKRIAERKVKRQLAQARARQLEPRQEPRIMAFGGEDPQRGFGFFGQN